MTTNNKPPVVSVIIPFHLKENQRYLDLCLESVRRQRFISYEVIIVTTEGVTPDLTLKDDRVRLITLPGESTFSKKINFGIANANKDSKYLMLLSDDVMLGENALFKMANFCADFGVMINPLSNCDTGYLYAGKIKLGAKQIPRQLNIDDLTSIETRAALNYNQTIDTQIEVHNLCFYATMIPRKVWEIVGTLDESYKTGMEDLDYCLRAKKESVRMFINFNAFSLHFGGKTSAATVTALERESNNEYFKSKWGFVPQL